MNNRPPLIIINQNQRIKYRWQTRLKHYTAEAIIRAVIFAAFIAALAGVGFLAWLILN